MQITRENPTPTTAKLTVSAGKALMDSVKQDVLRRLGARMRLPGFRSGKAPLTLVLRNADPTVLQSDFLDEALNRLYEEAVNEEKLRPAGSPKVELKKFVPFSALEFTVELEVVGEVKLPDYTKVKLEKKPVNVRDKDVEEVIENLRARAATRQDAKRPAKEGDEVTIDFTGKDAKSGEPVSGADGIGYPLVLGSNTFIPGFEPELLGMKAGSRKTFTLEFPKDYGVQALQARKVTFDVAVTKVQKLQKPEVNDEFATTVGPFKSLEALRQDIRSQLQGEKQYESDRNYESDLLKGIADKATVAIPDSLIDDETRRLESQARQNATYRGQTWQEYLKAIGQAEEAYTAGLRKQAGERVKAGLVLSEIADREGIMVTKAELELRLQLLKGQYKDAAMQSELDKPESKRSILSNMLTEKTLARLTELATAKAKPKE